VERSVADIAWHVLLCLFFFNDFADVVDTFRFVDAGGNARKHTGLLIFVFLLFDAHWVW